MYDVFISFKNRDNRGNITEDSEIAEAIYNELTRRGRSVFFSNYEISENGGGYFRTHIDRALDEAQILVLVSTSIDYIYSSQVEYEWKTRFYEQYLSGNKPYAKIMPYFKGIDYLNVDPVIRNFQIFDIERDTVSKFCDCIEKNLYITKVDDSTSVQNFGQEQYSSFNRRFDYRSGYTSLVGRKEELKFLSDFCIEYNSLTSWTMVSGKGGVGKSKLVDGFCRVMEEEGWRVCHPIHAKSYSKDELLKIDRNTLICFDYIKFEIDYVEDIIQAAIERRNNYKVRFILLERDEEVKNSFRTRIMEYHNPEGDIEVQPLRETDHILLAEEYINNVSPGKELSLGDCDNLIRCLKEIDGENMRPLFTLFIADAWLDEKNSLKDWDRESGVRYVASREIDRIHTVASNYSKSALEKKRYLDALNLSVVFSTFVGEISVDDLLELAHSFAEMSDYEMKNMLSDCELVDGNIVKGIVPDIIGEYISMDILNSTSENLVDIFFELLYKNYFPEMIAYLDKIYDDYEEAFMSSSWSSYGTKIKVPQSFVYISKNMFNSCHFIREVVLHENIKSISNSAFRDCVQLQKINFPSNLENIEEGAFFNCISLESALIEDQNGWVPSIIKIGDRAFMNCFNLREFKIPKSVKEIGRRAFERCRSLSSVDIPRDITSIEFSTFEGCDGLKEVIFKTDKENVVDIQAEAFKGCVSLSRIVGTSFIHYIGKGAFYDCKNLRELTFGEKLYKINEAAFKGCERLEQIDLSGSSVECLGKSSFEGCVDLRNVIPSNTLKNIGERCFYGCENLVSLNIPASIKSVGHLAFAKCESLTKASFGEEIDNLKIFCSFKVDSIDEDIISFVVSYYDKNDIILPKNINEIMDNAFKSDTNLEKITIQAGVKKIGKNAFRRCSNLKTVNGSLIGVKSIGEGAFSGCKMLSRLPGSLRLEKIEDHTFENCFSLEKINFESSVKTVGSGAFSNCHNLKAIYMEGKFEEIAPGAFFRCDNLQLSTRVYVDSKDKRYYVSGFIFERFGKKENEFVKNYCDMEEINLPSSCVGFFANPFNSSCKVRNISISKKIKKLIPYNFSGVESLEKITLPETIRNIPDGCFSKCTSLKEINIPTRLNKIEKNSFANCKLLSSIEIPSGVTSVGDGALAGCCSLQKVALPESIKRLGKSVFMDCTGLKEIEGLEKTQITTIRQELFRGCVKLEKVLIPSNVNAILAFAFYDCRSLEEINVVQSNISYIGLAAFQNCYMLRECILPLNVRIIDKFLFKNCSKLERVVLSPYIESIGTSAFFGCNKLIEIDVKDKNNLTRIGNDAFSGCHRLKSIVLPKGVNELPRGLFRDCVFLEEVEFLSNVEEIPVDCFKGCKSLKIVTSGGEIKKVGAGAFRNCLSLSNIEFLREINVAETASFRGCIALEDVNMDNLGIIPESMFFGCRNLKSISFSSVDRVDNYAFYQCENLERIPIDRINTRIGVGAFWGCTKIENITFSSSLKSIEPSAFKDCCSIKRLEFPNGIKSICGASFRDATSLSQVVIPESVERIKKSAFRGCSKLVEVKIESKELEIEKTAFESCSSLYYFSFLGKIYAHKTSFDGTPILESLKWNNKIEWRDES